MKLTSIYDPSSDEERYVLIFTRGELIQADLDPFDRKLLSECFKDGTTIADKLLGLEVLARRVQEGYETSMNKEIKLNQEITKKP